MAHAENSYFIPHGTRWPILGSIGLFILMLGFAMLLNESGGGGTLMIVGTAIVVVMIFLWFGQVIGESESGTYNDQVDISFRWGMGWFILSEVMFFAAFFGALWYARVLSIPWLGGEGTAGSTNEFLWPAFEQAWPTNGPGGIGGDFGTIPASGIPLWNTIILLSSGVTITFAHHALKASHRGALVFWMFATVALGLVFLYFQAEEFAHAYQDLNLTMGSGIYGSTFFMLTGFHGLHVTLGTIMLIVITLRCMKGHFTPQKHFAFEGVAWYWHFVDVVWLGLFIFVYWL
ncbi:MAG: cytochrome c oxidase subunit 3 [Thiotrichales bacterium]|nr:cytochrome c oxidase subunit 3 [Thiotrichales bacterium]